MQYRAPCLQGGGESLILPKLQCGGGGDEGEIVATERAVVLAGSPHVELRLDQRHRQRKSVAAERFRQAYDVRFDSGALEAEEGPGTSATRLDFIEDQQHLVPPRDGG